MELRREGMSYTSDTVAELRREYPDAELVMIMGTDMLLSFETWHEWREILAEASLAVLPREAGDIESIESAAERMRREYGAVIYVLDVAPLPMSSSQMRELLVNRQGADELDGQVYARIIKTRDYGAKPQFDWLRRQVYTNWLKPTRVPHVAGCESEAVKLALRWGEDTGDAAEAGILHDITKKFTLPEQLKLAEKYGIVFDALERENVKLTHAITGAALSRDLFGVTERVYGAIRWHTTGRPDMTLLEKIIYLADYIEPTRDFDGVEPLRALAYEDIDAAMALGLRMSLDELAANGIVPHSDSHRGAEVVRKGKVMHLFGGTARTASTALPAIVRVTTGATKTIQTAIRPRRIPGLRRLRRRPEGGDRLSSARTDGTEGEESYLRRLRLRGLCRRPRVRPPV